jgi:sigma-E factor negative regulatory protein RseB
VDSGSRQALGAPSPGTDPAALRLITAAVLAGLVIGSTAVIWTARSTPQVRLSSHAASQDRPPGAKVALQLLSRAAVASRTVAYAGVEMVDGLAGTVPATAVVHVWHAPGAVTLTQAVAPVPGWSGEAPHIMLPASSFGGQTLVGTAMLEMSRRLVSLLSANYRVRTVGWGQVAGRPARIVAAQWRHGGVAARFWLDRATALPLQRQTFDAAGRMVSDAAFIRVKLGQAAARPRPVAPARPWGDDLASPQLTALRAQGWPLPGPLPGNLALLGARQEVTGHRRVVDLDYSDGLSLVSVFVQRGHLPARMTGWSEVVVRGRHVYADDSSGQGLAWSACGFVYTVVAAAPAQTVERVVAALPYGGNPGFLARVSRGLRRLWSWLSP